MLRDTLWQGRRNNHTDLVSLLVANSSPALRRCSAARSPSWRCRSRRRPGGVPRPLDRRSSRWLRGTSPTSTARSTTTSSTRRGLRRVTHGERPPPAALRERRGRLLPRLPAARACWPQALLLRCARRLCRPSGARCERFVAAERSPPRSLARGPPAARASRPHRDARQRDRAAPRVAWRWPARSRAGRAPSTRASRPRELPAEAPAALAGSRLSGAYARTMPTRRPGGDRGARRRQDVPDPSPADRLAQGARAAPVHARRVPRAARAARHLLRRPPGRVLRHRRAQRLGQEHAAEDHLQHLPRRRAAASGWRAAGAVHRARRRLQPRADLARERRAQRRDDGPEPPRGASAGSTPCWTSPSCASSPTSS